MKSYKQEAIDLFAEGKMNKSQIARFLKDKHNLPMSIETVRKEICRQVGKHKALLQECERIGIPTEQVKHYWHKGKHFSINVKGSDAPSYDEIRDDLIEQMIKYSPHYQYIHRSHSKDGHLLVLDPADVHIGKLASSFETGEDYNNQIAVQRVREGVKGILDKTAGFNINKILFIAGNDILHIDTPKRTTTSGTPQDTDGMWYDNFLIAKQLYIEILEMLVTVADVHFCFNPSNHDYTNGFFLADTIQSWFSKCNNITFDCSISHRKYYTYGNNLIGSTHGDGAKAQDLPLLMAQESPASWAQTKHQIGRAHV